MPLRSSHSSSPQPSRSSRTAYHAKHRASAHHAAHQQPGGEHPIILAHPRVFAELPIMVDTAAGFDAVLGQLREAGAFAYDSEFIGEHTYHARLCLLQVATTQMVALIDPLAGFSVQPFWELVAEPGVRKIVHAGLQDIEPVFRHAHWPPANVFDVQIAAGFLQCAYPTSLVKLLEHFLQAKAGHSLKFSQWDRRPLSAAQIRYAADDVRYLPLLQEIMQTKLEAAGMAGWAGEACQEQLDPKLHMFDPWEALSKQRKAPELEPLSQAAAIRLLAWRENLAQLHDVPPRSLCEDGVLLAIAREACAPEPDLRRIRGLPRDLLDQHEEEIRTELTLARNDPLPRRLPVLSTSETQRAHALTLWNALEAYCQQQGIAPSLVTSKRELSLYLQARQHQQPTAAHRLESTWRRNLMAAILPA